MNVIVFLSAETVVLAGTSPVPSKISYVQFDGISLSPLYPYVAPLESTNWIIFKFGVIVRSTPDDLKNTVFMLLLELHVLF